MKYQELMKDIKQKQIKPVYLFAGSEQYIGNMVEHSMVENVISQGLEQLNLKVFEDKNPDISEILSVCETLPLMSEKRVVIIREGTGLTKISDKKTVDALNRYIDRPAETTVLILCDSSPDKRKKIYKTLKSQNAIVDFEKLSKIDLEKWIGRRLKLAQKRTTTRVVEQFIRDTLYIENENKNMEMVDNELNKIIDYVGEKDTITLEDVEAVMPKLVEDNIFKMIDYAMAGNKGAALKMLNQFYLEGEGPFGVFGLLLRQIRIMLMVKILAEKRMSPDIIAKQAKLAPFIVKKVLQNGRRYQIMGLKETMIAAADLDLKMKIGQIDAEFGVEWFVMKL